MTSDSKVRSWSDGLINSRTPRVYTSISCEKDRKDEALAKKMCLRCSKLKSHSEYRIGYDKTDEGEIKGLWRNNNCKQCEKRSTENNHPTLASLKEEVEALKECLEEKEKDIVSMKKLVDTNMKLFNASLENMAHCARITLRDDGSVMREDGSIVSKASVRSERKDSK